MELPNWELRDIDSDSIAEIRRKAEYYNLLSAYLFDLAAHRRAIRDGSRDTWERELRESAAALRRFGDLQPRCTKVREREQSTVD